MNFMHLLSKELVNLEELAVACPMSVSIDDSLTTNTSDMPSDHDETGSSADSIPSDDYPTALDQNP
jgi:hypothetical protein